MSETWFNVDKRGLAALMKGRSKAYILHELVSNAWDQQVTTVEVTIEPLPNKAAAAIRVVDDDPEGFTDLSHAYTLFASSEKKANAEKRGRFNLGEKLVLALAHRAEIITTKGGVRFDESGRHTLRGCRSKGSQIEVEVPITRAEMDEMIASTRCLIKPPGIKTTVNGEELPERESVANFQTKLPTLIADEEGVLRRIERKTRVQVYEPLPGEVAMLYEMGIPVVETGDRFHVDVQQKVLLNSDRDNVTPAYLRAVRVAVLNNVEIEPEDASQTWVREACSDERAAPEAVKKALTARFGENAVAYDPSDPEANKISTAEGRQIVYGGNLTAAEWENARRAGALPPAGQVTPSPKPFHPDGTPLNPVRQWTDGMFRVADFILRAHEELIGKPIDVTFVNDRDWKFNATYGRSGFILNLHCLGRDFFEQGISERVIDLVIHEFGHAHSSDHLSRAYNDALTMLGAKMTRLALEKPELFR
ncbi:MAG: hypothetical protein WD894_17020 [Pirellulales bacterium]